MRLEKLWYIYVETILWQVGQPLWLCVTVSLLEGHCRWQYAVLSLLLPFFWGTQHINPILKGGVKMQSTDWLGQPTSFCVFYQGSFVLLLSEKETLNATMPMKSKFVHDVSLVAMYRKGLSVSVYKCSSF